MEDFVKALLKAFQRIPPTTVANGSTSGSQKRVFIKRKSGTRLRFRNRSLQSSVVVACGFVLSVNLFPVLVKQPATFLC